MKQTIRDLIATITPYDTHEAADQQTVLHWIDSGAPLFRSDIPHLPSPHLVSFFAVYDPVASKILLVDHKKSGLLLPAGGHVEIDEHPRTTVIRETIEELNTTADFNTPFGDQPLFVTAVSVEKPQTHIDVSLWYVIKGDSSQPLTYDRGEITNYRWLGLDDILTTDISLLYSEMHRFVRKMQLLLYS